MKFGHPRAFARAPACEFLQHIPLEAKVPGTLNFNSVVTPLFMIHVTVPYRHRLRDTDNSILHFLVAIMSKSDQFIETNDKESKCPKGLVITVPCSLVKYLPTEVAVARQGSPELVYILYLQQVDSKITSFIRHERTQLSCFPRCCPRPRRPLSVNLT